MARLSDTDWMNGALRLAKKGAGKTFPNPAVGAVLVRGGRVVGRGFHRLAGLPHAEIEALRSAGKSTRGATLYVTLEPCNHTGRTPPCTDAIIKSGISRVVAATRDPNTRVQGKGIAKLRRAGISVSVGVRSKEAQKLNEQFFIFHEKKRPMVALKFAASMDGKLATRAGDSKWITNKDARAFARNLRGEYRAILVGVGTVVADNPHLGVRKKGMKDPLRVIIDPNLRAPLSSKVFRDRNVVVATLTRASQRRRALFTARGIRLLLFRGKNIPVKKLLAELGKLGVESVMVEGGGETLGKFLDARAVDRVYAFYAPVLIGGEQAIGIGGKGVGAIAAAIRFSDTSVTTFGDNVLISGDVSRAQRQA